jgi:hypothetical protein
MHADTHTLKHFFYLPFFFLFLTHSNIFPSFSLTNTSISLPLSDKTHSQTKTQRKTQYLTFLVLFPIFYSCILASGQDKKVFSRMLSVFNFINILWVHFLYESALHSFSLVTSWLCNFFVAQKYLKKASIICWWNWHVNGKILISRTNGWVHKNSISSSSQKNPLN